MTSYNPVLATLEQKQTRDTCVSLNTHNRKWISSNETQMPKYHELSLSLSLQFSLSELLIHLLRDFGSSS